MSFTTVILLDNLHKLFYKANISKELNNKEKIQLTDSSRLDSFRRDPTNGKINQINNNSTKKRSMRH
jgi:hypothetical protein